MATTEPHDNGEKIFAAIVIVFFGLFIAFASASFTTYPEIVPTSCNWETK